MKKILLIILFSSVALVSVVAQRANVFAAFQLIESEKFEDAKKAIDEALKDEKTRQWSKSWYARGLLCQKAYAKGIKNNDKKLIELYPDQLFLAYESFEKSISLKRNARITDQLEPIYIELANDLMKMGKQAYKDKQYEQALKAYENALEINESPILSVALDSSLVYNTALSAYMSKNTEKSVQYLKRLNAMKYSSNIPHLLSRVYLETGDTLSAMTSLKQGVKDYNEREDLVLLYTDLLFDSRQYDRAVAVLDSAFAKDPVDYIYPYTKGLLYQKIESYEKAIEAYKEALKADPENLSTFIGIGTCYFNMGVVLEENAREINNNRKYQEELDRSISARNEAVIWLEKALEKSPGNQEVRDLLLQLYRSLHMTDKIGSLEP